MIRHIAPFWLGLIAFQNLEKLKKSLKSLKSGSQFGPVTSCLKIPSFDMLKHMPRVIHRNNKKDGYRLASLKKSDMFVTTNSKFCHIFHG